MPEGSNSRWAGAKLPRPPLRTRQRSIKPAVAKKTYLDELPYYSSYQLAENEVPLARYLLPSDPSEVQRGVEHGRFPTLTNLARLQRQLGQPPNPSGDKANESPPAPFPPRRTKAELLGSTDFSATDEFARSVTLQPSDDWERLAQRLFEQSRSNLDKVRAAFCFACMHRDLPEVEHAGQPYENARAGNFNQVFAALLIIADVPMQVISGYKKGVGYESGLKAQLGGVWFACYVEGEWRFVDPHWAAQSISDYDTGNYGRIDQRGYVKTGTETDGTTNYQLNEFWFLTDPDQFAVNHFPSQDQLQWQLLARPLSFHEFEEIINYFDGTEQEMDHYQLEPVNYPKNLIVARPGPVVIQLKELAGEPYIYDRQLMIHRKHISEELKTAVLSAYQQRACLSKAIRVTKDTVKFVFEPPHQGQYALAIKLWRLVTEDALRGCTYATYTIHCPQSWESDDVIPEGLEDLDEFGAGRSLRQAGFASDAPGELKAADGEAELVIELLEKDGDSRSLMCLALGPDDQPLPAGSVLMWLDESRNAFLFLAPDSGYYALVLYEADQPVGQFLVDASSEAKDGGSFPLPDWDRVGGLGFAADPTRRARRLVPLSHPTPYVRTEDSELSMQFGVISGDADTVLLCKESGEEKGHISDFGIIGSTVGKDESGSTVGKDESGSTVGKDESGSTVGKCESGSTVGKDESGITVGKDECGITVGKDESGITVGKDESGITVGKDESGITVGKYESGSTVGRDESGSTIGKDESGSTVGKDKSGSTVGNDESGSQEVKAESGITDVKEEIGSTVGKDESDSTVGKDESDSTVGKDDSGSTVSKDESASTIGKDESGSQEVKAESSSTDVKEESGSTDVKEESGSTDVKEESGSTDVKEESGSTDVKEESGSTDVKEESDSTVGKDESDITVGKDDSGSTVGKDESASTIGKDESASTIGKDESASTIGKDESASTIGKDESGSQEVKAESGITDVKEEIGSTVGKDESGSTVGKDESDSTVGKDESGSTVGKDESGSQEVKAESGITDVKEEIGSTVGKDESGSTVGKDDSGSTVGKDDSGSTVGKDDSGSTVGKDESGSTVGKDDSGSTVGKDDSGSTVGKDESCSIVGKDDSGSTVGKDESASTIGKEESGSQEVKAESGSTVVKEESGKRPVVESGKYNGSDEMQSCKGDLSDDIITGGVGIGSCDEVKYNLAHSISVESDPGRKDFSNVEFGAKKDDVETHVGRIAIADVGRIELRAEMLVVGADSSTEPLTDFCLVSGIEEGGYEVRCRFPRAGHYLLRLTSREGGGDWRLFYTYFVRAVGQLDGSAAAFPRLAHDWPAGGALLEPLDRTLPVALPTPFRIRLGDSTATAIDGVEILDERSGHREALSRDPADQRLWVGSVTAQGGDSADAEDDKGGGVTVVARLEGGTEVELVKLDIESKASAEAKAAALREAESLNERREALEENRKRKQENRNRRDQGLEPLLIKTYAEVIADVEANSAAALAKVAARRKALALASSAANAAAEANAALKSAVAAASGVKALARAVPKYVAQAQAAAKSAAMAESATIAAAEVEEISKSAEGARMTAKASAQAETSAKAATLATSQIEAILGIASEAETKTKLAAEAAANAATSSAFEAEAADSAEADVAVKSAAASSEEAEASARAVAEIVVKVTTEFGVASKGSEMAAAAAEAAAKSAADANAAAKEASEMVAAEKAETKMLIAQLDAALLERSLARLRKTIQLLRRHEVKLRGTSLKKYQEAQLTLTALQHRKDLRDAMAEAQRTRNSHRLRTLVQRLEDEAEREPLTEAQLALFREDLRLAREAIQRDDRLERMPQHRLEMNPKSLTELRQYSRPVEAVHKTVQALLLLLGNYEKRTRKWPRCQPLLKNITKLVADFQPRLVDPRIAARSREILDGIDKREIALQSAAAFSFYEWAVKTTDSIKEVCTSDDFVPAKMAQQRCILGVTVEEDAELNFQDEGTRK